MINLESYRQFGVILPKDLGEQIPPKKRVWIKCPKCSGPTKEKNALGVWVNLGLWNCQACGYRGDLKIGSSHEKGWAFKSDYLPPYAKNELSPPVKQYLKKAFWSDPTMEECALGEDKFFNPVTLEEDDTIAIPYRLDGTVVNVKYLFKRRIFSFERGAQILPFGMDDVKETETIIVCKTEAQKAFLKEHGFPNAISLPFMPDIKMGNKQAVNQKLMNESLVFLDEMFDRFFKVKKFILCIGASATDGLFTEELARRLGRERTWTASWPKDCLSIDDVAKQGQEAIHFLISQSSPYPIKGICEFSDVKSDFDQLYESGLKEGPKTGLATLDEYYRPALGQWTLVTGIPSHGKSNWVDDLLVNLALKHEWNFAFFSPENQPVARHFANLSEKLANAPFSDKAGHPKMSIAQKEDTEKKLATHFSIIMPDDESGNWGIDGILDLAKALVTRKGIKGLVIDPWNELDHTRPNGLTETEYISKVLTKIRRFARLNSVHVWLVAHPTKMFKNKETNNYPVPAPYDVAGSAHFLNKADFCISIYRFPGQPDQTITDVYIQKVRFKENGKVGMASFSYEPHTGRFVDNVDQAKRKVALENSENHPADYYKKIEKRVLPEF